MGYTQHWYLPEQIPIEKFSAILADAALLIIVFNRGDSPVTDLKLTEDLIIFEGGCEPFRIHRNAFKQGLSGMLDLNKPKSPVFYFCKTLQLPYDELVEAILFAIEYHLEENCYISPKPHWKTYTNSLYSRVFEQREKRPVQPEKEGEAAWAFYGYR